ncbi:MAG: hypothetical protein QNJ54_28615 [Prochloraceae cyanobacterium]|nr:hypothetical protein [Prochloraceae cyanobacterium]
MTNPDSNGHKNEYKPTTEYEYSGDAWAESREENEDDRILYPDELKELIDEFFEDEESSEDEEDS